MRLLYDAYWWSSGPPSNREVMREILTNLVSDHPDEVTIFTKATEAESVVAEIVAATGVTLPFVTTRIKPHGVALLVDFQRHASSGRYDAVLTHNFSVRHPRSAVFLQDVLFVTNPEWFTWLERRYFSLMARTVGRAEIVFASSRAEAERIRRVTRARRIEVVGLAPRQSMLRTPAVAPSAAIAAGRYVLCVGRMNVRKNVRRAVYAALQLPATLAEQIVVVGGDIPAEWAAEESVRLARESGRLVAPGFISEGELRWLYENAAVVVMPSLGEGFGMPVAEAALFHRPIVASDIGPFREIADGVVFVDPHSVDSIREGLERALRSPARTRIRPGYEWSTVTARIREHMAAG